MGVRLFEVIRYRCALKSMGVDVHYLVEAIHWRLRWGVLEQREEGVLELTEGGVLELTEGGALELREVEMHEY